MAVITDSLWKQRFGADAGVIGKAITLDADRYIIIGVLPPSTYVGYEQLYVPFLLPPNHKDDRYAHWLKVVGRIGPDYTLEHAQTEMDILARRIEKDHPQTNTGWGIRLVRLHDQLAASSRPALLLLLGAVSLVLAIACANVSNLLLARSVPRPARDGHSHRSRSQPEEIDSPASHRNLAAVPSPRCLGPGSGTLGPGRSASVIAATDHGSPALLEIRADRCTGAGIHHFDVGARDVGLQSRAGLLCLTPRSANVAAVGKPGFDHRPARIQSARRLSCGVNPPPILAR